LKRGTLSIVVPITTRAFKSPLYHVQANDVLDIDVISPHPIDFVLVKQARLEAWWHVHDAQIPTGSIEYIPAGGPEIFYEVVQLDLFVGKICRGSNWLHPKRSLVSNLECGKGREELGEADTPMIRLQPGRRNTCSEPSTIEVREESADVAIGDRPWLERLWTTR